MKTFLTGHWQNLLMFNYEIHPALLKPYLPKGTELDLFNGTCYVSLVGFMFLHTRIKNIAFPFHSDFEEFNLRFYVKFKEGNEWKRGVVFVKEIVPRRMISLIARKMYREHYVYYPMRHSLKINDRHMEVKYEWFFEKQWNYIQAITETKAHPIAQNSEAEFITEHYWGYTKINDFTTSEYNVMHPRWEIFDVQSHEVNCNVQKLYGDSFVESLSAPPKSVFMAKGSDVTINERKLWKY